MLACLAKVYPLDTVSGNRVEIRLSAHNDAVIGRAVNGLDGAPWQPAMAGAPILRITLFNGDFTNAVSIAQAALPINMTVLGEARSDLGRLAWQGAPVEIYADEPGTAWPWALRFKGVVAGYSRPAAVLTLNVAIDSEPFLVDSLPSTYAGTGGAEGPLDLKGRVKPLVLGWAMNVEPVLINAVDSVYQFSAYGEIEAVTKLYERGSDFGASIGDYATYAALVAATIPPGRWATCLAAGMVRLGAPAYGVITGDIKGHKVGANTPRLTGAVISAIATIAGVSGSLIDSTSLSALDSALPYPINIVLTDQATVLDIAQRLALPCNAQAGIGFDGKLFVTRVSFSTPASLTVDAQGKTYPQVTDSREENVSPPFYRYTMGANRSWRVHSFEEIAFEAPIVPRGLYDAAETYREGNIVSLADGSEWIYVSLTPTAGNAPPTWPTTSNAYWSNTKPPLNAEGITYADGTPIEDLRPSEPGADVTTQQVPFHDPAGASAVFTANYQGTLDAGQLPFNIQIKRMSGTTDVSADATWSIITQGSISGGTVTVTDGVVTIPSGCSIPISTDIDVQSTYLGFDLIARISITRVDSPPPSTGSSGGGTTVNDSTLNSVSGTTQIALSDVMTVKTGPSGTITFAGGLSVIVAAASPDGLYGVRMRWKYRPVGGSFSDVGSLISETSEGDVLYDSELNRYFKTNGAVNVAATQTGLSATTDYEVQLWGAQRSGDNTKTLTFGGTVSATGS